MGPIPGEHYATKNLSLDSGGVKAEPELDTLLFQLEIFSHCALSLLWLCVMYVWVWVWDFS